MLFPKLPRHFHGLLGLFLRVPTLLQRLFRLFHKLPRLFPRIFVLQKKTILGFLIGCYNVLLGYLCFFRGSLGLFIGFYWLIRPILRFLGFFIGFMSIFLNLCLGISICCLSEFLGYILLLRSCGLFPLGYIKASHLAKAFGYN